MNQKFQALQPRFPGTLQLLDGIGGNIICLSSRRWTLKPICRGETGLQSDSAAGNLLVNISAENKTNICDLQIPSLGNRVKLFACRVKYVASSPYLSWNKVCHLGVWCFVHICELWVCEV